METIDTNFTINENAWDLMKNAAPHRDFGCPEHGIVKLNFDNSKQIQDYLDALSEVHAALEHASRDLLRPVVTMRFGKK